MTATWEPHVFKAPTGWYCSTRNVKNGFIIPCCGAFGGHSTKRAALTCAQYWCDKMNRGRKP